MTETVLVIGGTGELGAPVARQLHDDGYRVRVLARSSQQLATAALSWSTPEAT